MAIPDYAQELLLMELGGTISGTGRLNPIGLYVREVSYILSSSGHTFSFSKSVYNPALPSNSLSQSSHVKRTPTFGSDKSFFSIFLILDDKFLLFVFNCFILTFCPDTRGI